MLFGLAFSVGCKPGMMRIKDSDAGIARLRVGYMLRVLNNAFIGVYESLMLYADRAVYRTRPV